MFKKFVVYYLIIISSLFTLVFIIDYAFQYNQKENASKDINVSYLVKMVEEYCATDSCKYSENLPFSNVRILPFKNVSFPSASIAQLDSKEILSISDNSGRSFYYSKLGEHSLIQITVLTPDEENSGWYTASFYLVLFGVIFAFMYPLFRDMFHLKQAATKFVQHRNIATIELPHSRYFQPVNDTIIWMIEKISKLLALQKELSDTLSHELRTSVSRLNFSLATLDKNNTEEIKEILQEDVDELKLLVEEYLTFSRQEHDVPNLNFKTQSIVPIVEHYIYVLGQYSHKEISLNVASDALVNIENRAISRAIKNLIDNAVKYSSDKVSITIFVEETSLIVQIEDDGVGLELEGTDELFLPYKRSANTQKTSGYGLGLAITHKIIAWHRGEIKASNSEKMTGACFRLELPVAK